MEANGHRINAEEKISIIRYQLDQAISNGTSTIAERSKLKQELHQAYIDEEIFCKQKSRNLWLKERDRNTKYFHSIIKTRRAKNRMLSIQDASGTIRRSDKKITEVATNYFKEVFKSQTDSNETYGEVFRGFKRKITPEVNEDLIKEVSYDEIKKVVFSIEAHGLDGFTGDFYQQFWMISIQQ